jgi:GTP-binding protein HflX
VRRWSHLERQTGGAGVRGGPGEKQIELDKRMIGEAIKRCKERLSKVKKQRQTQRRQRDRKNAFSISLVGYTNAGKSTLFNALVKAKTYAADQLFATLDTTTRQLYLGDAQRMVSLSDTVGFIRDLPHGLVNAFAATLQEAADADLLLHVVDAANPDYLEQIEQVQRVLEEIGAADVTQILIFNKLDALEKSRWPLQLSDMFEVKDAFSDATRRVERVFVSAQTGDGLPRLRQLLSAHAALGNALDIPETFEVVV